MALSGTFNAKGWSLSNQPFANWHLILAVGAGRKGEDAVPSRDRRAERTIGTKKRRVGVGFCRNLYKFVNYV